MTAQQKLQASMWHCRSSSHGCVAADAADAAVRETVEATRRRGQMWREGELGCVADVADGAAVKANAPKQLMRLRCERANRGACARADAESRRVRRRLGGELGSVAEARADAAPRWREEARE